MAAVCGALLALAPTTAASATGPGAAHPTARPTPTELGLGAGSCFANLTGDAGQGVVSQNFEDSFNQYDSQGADDFTITARCAVTAVVVPGWYFGGAGGPALSETVTIYKNRKAKPRKVVTSQTVKGSDSAGSFEIPLKKTVLKPRRYWLSVVVNMDYLVGGGWNWETTNDQVGRGALWRNPADGFATGCTDWADMVTCIGPSGEGPDFLFSLGRAKGGPPGRARLAGWGSPPAG